MNLFPLILGRIGGLPIDTLDGLRSAICIPHIATYIELQRHLEEQRKRIIEHLYTEISKEQNNHTRNKLLNLKRDIYNRRASITKYSELTDVSWRFDLERYWQKEKQLQELLQAFNSVFKCEEETAIREVRNLAKDSIFKNGLLFSSHVLLNKITKQPELVADRRQINSLIKYLTRSAAKTTPFSTFNSIFYLYNASKKFTSGSVLEKSSIEASNLLYHHLKNRLLSNRTFRQTLIVKINSTTVLNTQNCTFNYFQNENNNESFKRINYSPTLEAIVDAIRNSCISYKVLISNLKQLAPNDDAEIEAYLEKLIHEGFLKLIFPVHCTNKTWPSDLVKVLDVMESDIELEKLKEILETIDSTTITLQRNFDVDKRMQLIHHCHRTIFGTPDSQNNSGQDIDPQDLFYENHFTTVAETLRQADVENLLTEVSLVFSSLHIVSNKKSKRESLARIFKQQEHTKLPILNFYQNIYLPSQNDQEFLTTEIKKASEIVFNIFHEIERSSEQTTYDISLILNGTQKVDPGCYFGFYVQAEDIQLQNVVINSFCMGNGVNISRFLNNLPEKYVNDLVAHNRNSLPEKVLIEIKDASIHNVGNFPKLTDSIIDLCDNRYFNGQYEITSLTNIFVTHESQTGLTLVDQDNNPVQILNFSLEGLNRRSAFFRFTDLFNETDFTGITFVFSQLEALFKKKVANSGIASVPRIMFGKKITLQRRKWLVLKSFITNIIANSSGNGEVFLTLNSFIREHTIPAEVFVKFNERNRNDLVNDRYKPQYFNLNAPVFTALFIDELKKAGNVIEFIEMLPTSENVKKTGGRVKEYLFNYY